jgi:hypothetical protein
LAKRKMDGKKERWVAKTEGWLRERRVSKREMNGKERDRWQRKR